MSAPRWAVWSYDPRSRTWVEVETGLTEAEAAASAQRRNVTAARLDMGTDLYRALPEGRQPRAAREVATVTVAPGAWEDDAIRAAAVDRLRREFSGLYTIDPDTYDATSVDLDAIAALVLYGAGNPHV